MSGKPGGQRAMAVYAAAVAALLLWAGTPVANKLAVESIDAATAGMLRSVLAGPVALFVALAMRLPFPARGEQRRLLILSGITSFAVWPTLLSIGLSQTTANHAALIIAMIPVFTGLIAAAVDRTWPRFAWWAGISIAAAGTAFLIFYRDAAALVDGGVSIRGDLMVLAGAIVCALGYVTGGKLTPVIGTWATTFWGLVVAAATMIPMAAALSFRTDWSQVSVASWLALAYLAFIGSFTAYLAWFWALGHGGITRMSSWQLGQPVLTFILAAIVLNELVTPPLLIAGAVILAGTALAQSPGKRR